MEGDIYLALAIVSLHESYWLSMLRQQAGDSGCFGDPATRQPSNNCQGEHMASRVKHRSGFKAVRPGDPNARVASQHRIIIIASMSNSGHGRVQNARKGKLG